MMRAQAVADGHAEAALERLGVELAVSVGQGFAIAGGGSIRQLQTPPLYARIEGSVLCGNTSPIQAREPIGERT